MKIPTPEIWFVTGSQHLYGPGPLKQVAAHSQEIVEALNHSKKMALPLVFKSLVTRPEEIRRVCQEASSDPNCAGLILWMHTFSPSKMWIGGLSALRKPFLHLHTQFNRDLPWGEIDMDFMNLNQAAHGDREAGFIHTRLRLNRKVVVGHWSDAEVQERIGAWMRVARAWNDWQGAEFARFADNMRYVAVTEGDKVSAEARFGYSVNHYAVGDLVEHVNAVSDAAVTELCAEYEERYAVAAPLRKNGARHESLRDGARIELGLRSFLEEGNFKGFTTNFQDLHGLKQLPGLAVQRLMADGYGFAGEGDWKTCRAGSRNESHRRRSQGRHLLHGGLYLPPLSEGSPSARLTHAGGLRVHRRRKAKAGNPSSGHRRERKTPCAWFSTRRREMPSMPPSSIWATASG